MKLIDKVFIRRQSLSWAKKGNEIAKYKPFKYNSIGVYQDTEEWTDYYSVGNEISYDDYKIVEDKYVCVIREILTITDCKYITLVSIECCDKLLRTRLKSIGRNTIRLNNNKQFKYHLDDKRLFLTALNIYEGKRISVEKVDDIVRICLRGHANTLLCNENKKVFIGFPGSFYIWANFPLKYLECIKQYAESVDLFFNPRG